MTTLVVAGILASMTETRLDRLVWLIETHGGDEDGGQAAFARMLGLDPRNISVLKARLKDAPDKAGIDGVTLGKMMRTIGVNPVWFLFGEEPRYIDAQHTDPELAPFLAMISDQQDLKRDAFKAHARVSEIKALLGLLDSGALRTYTTKDGGGIDWLQAVKDLRKGKLSPSTATPTTAGTERARKEQGVLPKTIDIPEGVRRKTSRKNDRSAGR